VLKWLWYFDEVRPFLLFLLLSRYRLRKKPSTRILPLPSPLPSLPSLLFLTSLPSSPSVPPVPIPPCFSSFCLLTPQHGKGYFTKSEFLSSTLLLAKTTGPDLQTQVEEKIGKCRIFDYTQMKSFYLDYLSQLKLYRSFQKPWGANFLFFSYPPPSNSLVVLLCLLLNLHPWRVSLLSSFLPNLPRRVSLLSSSLPSP
jgi:hypothetical protein